MSQPRPISVVASSASLVSSAAPTTTSIPTAIVPPTASAASPSVTPAASVPTTPGSEPPNWDKRLWALYGSYSKGIDARALAYRQLFAPQLQQYLGKRNVSVDHAVQMMESFFRVRPNPYYVIRGSVETPSKLTARALVEAQWEEVCPSEWAQENFVCERRVRLKVHVEADESGRITQFDEAAGPRFQYRVVADSVSGYAIPHSNCDDTKGPSSEVEVPKGAIVEATGRYVQNFGCGPCERLIQFLHEGNPYWTVQASCIRVYDEKTGPHTGGEDFLLELQ